MNVNTDRQVNWFKLGVEGIVIVVSILLAFALEAWWENRKEAQAEHDMLLALESELQGALSMLDGQLALHNLQADSSKAIAADKIAAGEGEVILVNNQDIATLF